MTTTLLSTLAGSRQYTLAVAEAMPEGDYGFKPADAVWTFAELMHHIAYGILWWDDNFIKGKKMEWNPTAGAKDKKAVLRDLEEAFDSLEKTVKGIKPGSDETHGFHATLDHVTHHRGAATIYLRCRNIIPPEYQY